MRVSSTQFHTTMNTALQQANSALAQVMQQMSSGKRVMKASDDTIATVRLARLSREESTLGQYRDNIASLRQRLQASEVTLDAGKDDLQQVRDLLVWAADGSNTPADLAAMGSSLESLRDSLFHTTNSTNAEGNYLFSGTTSDQPTVVDSGVPGPGRYTAPTANTGGQQVSVANQVTLQANVTLAPEMTGFLNTLDTLIQQVKGSAVPAGAIAATITSLDTTLDAVSGKISEIGRRQNMLDTLDDNHAAVSLSNQQAASDLGQLDYAEASVRMNSYMTAVQATQKAYAKVSALSLFNVL